MRRLILVFFVFILFGIVLSLVFRDHQGYLLIAFNGWQIETSLLFACVALLVGIWVLVTLWRLLVGGVLLPSRFRGFMRRRRTRKARKSMYAGMQRMAEGRWARAEKELGELAERHEAPGLNYLHAARAAQHQGHIGDRDRYLKKAASKRGTSELAVLLTQAELQIDQGQTTEASATLSRLYQIEPKHPLVLRLYAEQALANGDHAQLREAMPAIRRYSELPAERLQVMATAAWCGELQSKGKDLGALTGVWRRVPKALRSQPKMATCYVECLRHANAEDEAANVIRHTLKTDWDAGLVLLFGEIKTGDQTAQLATIEEWLKHYGQEPELLLVAGRLCLRNRLWGRARSYFEASQGNQSRPDALLELGRLFEQINEKDEARSAYRRGLELRI